MIRTTRDNANSLSGVVDILSAFSRPIHPVFNAERYFGGLGQLAGSQNDLYALVDKLSSSKKPVPKFYLPCGTADFLLATNRKFKEHLQTRALDFCYEEGPGAHDWDFWNLYLRKSLDWLQKGKN